ncbi:serine hydrolase domain-containing protein [Streptomyces pinistramenti]|uniref:serine hydrolase domain-containing protein n=1 Tax=Streptomyces pinistramenti TaxID=2884812 RepID=UPI001D07E1A5|nr:serine hydrolase domain-containing protein [Streptomyces pinistramenti]MCB5907806.1 beta-lactamase family protein [Streptomyces pinistramenti]
MTAPSPTQADLRAIVDSVDAPDVVLALSQEGHRTIVTGGTGLAGARGTRLHAPACAREDLRFEIGSVTKTFTGLLLATLAHQRVLGFSDRLSALLPPPVLPHARRDAITLFHLATHTSGLPRLPWSVYLQPRARFHANPYAHSTQPRMLGAFARCRPRSTPGTRWHYSNFGVALLGPALTHATGTPFPNLMATHVLGPLGLADTTLSAPYDHRDALGHDLTGDEPCPPFAPGGWGAAGAVRATPGDLLSYLEALLDPGRHPLLADALRYVREPLLRHGRHREHTHSLSWFQHPSDHGPFFFHSGATPGQEAILAFRPSTATALVALANRRYPPAATLQQSTYNLLA